MLDSDLLEREWDSWRCRLWTPLQGDADVDIGERPGQVDTDAELTKDMEGIKDIGIQTGIDGQANTEAKSGQLCASMEPETAMKMGGVPTDQGAAINPGIDSHTQRPKLPGPIIANPGPQGELVCIEHDVGVGCEEMEELGTDAHCGRVFLAEVEMPGMCITEAEEGFGSATNIDQSSRTVVLVMGIQAHQECPGPRIQDPQGAEGGIFLQGSTWLEHAG